MDDRDNPDPEATANVDPDLSTIRAALEMRFEPLHDNEILELRVLGFGDKHAPVSGYFDYAHLEQMALMAAELSRIAEGVYVTLNPVRGDLIARARNRGRFWPKATTADGEITRRIFLLIISRSISQVVAQSRI